MKKLIDLLMIIVFLATAGAPSAFSQRGWESCSAKKSSMQQDLTDLLSPNTPKHKFDVLNYTLDLRLYQCYHGSYPNSFNASVIITFRVDTALNSISLNANNASLVIDNVSLAGFSYSHANNILTINLDNIYQPDAIVEVKIDYHHMDVTDNAFYSSGGFVFTDCEPEGARKWFPCWDKPSDKATLDLTARVDADVRLGSNGRLEDSLVSGDTLIYHWISRDPISTYLMVITSRVDYNLDIVYWTNPQQPLAPPTPIRFYYNPGENPYQIEAMITDVFDFFSEKFGAHPFEKNGFATLNNQFSWGGMENQTLTSLCPGCWYESVVVHEFAHQWFGDMITCGTWADIFLNEGFATYLEALWLEHQQGYSGYKGEIDYDADGYLTNNPGWAISNPSWATTTPSNNQLFNYAVTYAKGACVLHQLRYVMGDSLFFQGMYQYATDTINLKFQNALIGDFKEKMEQVYGQPLDWYFNEWIYQPNHPEYQNSYNIVNMGNGTWRVRFFAKQVQNNPAFFKMPIELRIQFSNGSDTLIRVMNDVNNQLFEFYFTIQPTLLTFDPGNQIVLKEASLIVGNEDLPGVAASMHLFPNQPNPFSSGTEISYELPLKTRISLNIHDVTGKKVMTLFEGDQEAGLHRQYVDGSRLVPGMYFYTLEAEGFRQTCKMLVE